MTYLCLGLDLSLSDTGIAVMDELTRNLVHLQTVKSTPKDGTHIERADFIAATITDVVEEFRPQLIVIEEYAFSRPTAVATLGELGGIVKHALWKQTGYPDCFLTAVASSVKKELTGSGAGAGGKERMLAWAMPHMEQYSNNISTLSAKDFKNNNLSDAVGLAEFGIIKYGHAVRPLIS